MVRVDGNDTTTITRVESHACRGVWEMSKCGRPLGMRFDSRGYLYVIDAYNGIKTINVSTGSIKTVVNTRKRNVDGRDVIFVDDFVIDEGAGSNGGHVFYITDSSAKWELEFVNAVALEHESTGRVLRYDEDSSELTVVAAGIGFPNGIEITDDKQAILYDELNKRRIVKLYIRGAKAGQSEIFAENLPGEPDNIRRSASSHETYWVGLYEGKSPEFRHQDPMFDFFATTPSIRKVIFRISYHLGDVIMKLGEFLDFVPLIEGGFNLRATFTYQQLYKPYGLVIELNAKGDIVRALHSPDGKTTLLSEAREIIEGGRRVLYLGSFYNTYLGKLVLEE